MVGKSWKKFLPLIITIVALLAAGCGGGQQAPSSGGADPTDGDSSPAGGETYNLSIGTGGTSGTYYFIGAGMSKLFDEFYPQVKLAVEVTAAGMENLRLLYNNQIDLAIADGASMTLFSEEQPGGLDDMREISGGHSQFLHLIVPADSPITSIRDIVGKRVSVGAAASGNEVVVRTVLGFYDITYDDFTPMFLNYQESVDAMKDGQLDMFFLVTGMPAVAVTDLQTTMDIKLLTMEPDMVDKVIEAPGMIRLTLPANTYKDQPDPIPGVGINAQLLVRSEMPDDLAYLITKGIAEHWQVIEESHPAGAEWAPNPETVFRGSIVDFHPGAQKYWEEIGIWSEKDNY